MIHTTPYIKQYDKDGVLINPITKYNPYITHSENRRKRRATIEKDKPGKMYIVGVHKIKTSLQLIRTDEGIKRIIHTI